MSEFRSATVSETLDEARRLTAQIVPADGSNNCIASANLPV
ncbi:hypothetical protein [Inquilinus sp. Marseille-Q2685]|nr:hypothetical protein [Inquilinus sp. Marseille-Q2685]